MEESSYYLIPAKDLGYCDPLQQSDQLEEVSKILDAYSRDESFAPAKKLALVVKPKNTDEVERIVTSAFMQMVPREDACEGRSTWGQLLR